MDRREITEMPARRPAHAGFVIAHLLMPNAGLDQKQLATLLQTTDDRTARILSGEEPLSGQDARNLRDTFGAAAENLMRVQVIRAFYDRFGRRPTYEEKLAIFKRPSPAGYTAG